MNCRFLRVACLVALVAAAAGCSSANAGPPKPAHLEKTTLTVGAVPVADEVGLYIAKSEGFFAAEGLNVKIDSLVSSADATKGQNDGTYDVTAGNSVSYIQDEVAGRSNLEIVAEGSLMEAGNQALYTLPGSSITSVTDLKGRRIGVNALNNIGTLLVTSVLKEYGLSAHQVHFVPMNFPQMGQALERHQIDAAWLPEPFGSAGAESQGLTELADLDQGATTGFPVGWYVVTKAWARKYPHTLAAFLDALREGQQVADTSRAAVADAMEHLPAPYTVPAAIAAVMSVETYPLTIAPGIDLTRTQRVANEMYQYGMLKSPFQVNTMLGGLLPPAVTTAYRACRPVPGPDKSGIRLISP
jgi:NitT/TauT family transport system substrate-binding protein